MGVGVGLGVGLGELGRCNPLVPLLAGNNINDSSAGTAFLSDFTGTSLSI